MGEYGQGNIGDIVKKKTVVVFSEEAPPPGNDSLIFTAQKFGGNLRTVGSQAWFRGTRIRLSTSFHYIRISYGEWQKYYPDPNSYDAEYQFVPEALTDWLSIEAGPDWFEINCPDFVYEKKRYHGDDSSYSNTITLFYIWKEGNGPPPFPYDPNNPTPPQPPPQGELKLWCKVGGTVHRAKKLYIKQNGVLMPVKKILGR